MTIQRLIPLILLAFLVSCASTKPSSVERGATPPAKSQIKTEAPKPQAQPAPVSQEKPAFVPPADPWSMVVTDTTTGADYLSATEKQIIIELNRARTNPPEYAKRYLAPLRAYYHRQLLQFPGEVAILTKEGVSALEECVQAMQVQRPLFPLSPSKGLTLATRDHVKDQSETRTTGHTGTDGSTMKTRMERYGKWGEAAGEAIDYGNQDPRRIVMSLLIDDGVASRGHRKILLEGSFKVVGLATGTHGNFNHMCVMDFAGAFKE